MNAPETPVRSSGRGILAAGAIVLMLCAAVLTAATSYVLYRTGRAIESLEGATARLGERLDRIGAQGERMAGSAAGVAGDIEKLSHRVESLADRVDLVEGWNEALRGAPAKAGEAEQRLIDGLLGAVRSSGLKFVRGGDEKSAWRMWGWLYAKYQVWKPTIGSADEFITKVASESLTGDPYQVVLKDGTKVPLADWLRERLGELRAAPAPPAETPAKEK